MNTKTCSNCGISKNIESFNWQSKAKNKRHSKCSDCTKEISSAHYQDNKEIYKKRARTFTKQKIEENQEKIYTHLSKNPCIDCGEKDPVVLQFDHVRGKKKQIIAKMLKNCCAWETIKSEMEKCEVRCANCHTRRTAKQFSWYKLK